MPDQGAGLDGVTDGPVTARKRGRWTSEFNALPLGRVVRYNRDRFVSTICQARWGLVMLHSKWLPRFLLAAFLASRANSAQTPPSPVLTASQLFEKASPAVVKIIVKDEDDQPIDTGSGFVVDRRELGERGGAEWTYVVTNHHVIRAGVSARVEFGEVATQPAQVQNPPTTSTEKQIRKQMRGMVMSVVMEDERSDLAVLLVGPTQHPDPVLVCRDDPLPPVGTPVFVISSPEGLHNTLSAGLISGYRERDNGEKWIQISAPVGPGSSGGPVLMADGKVIGVTVGTLPEAQNVNFAVSIGALRRMLKGKFSDRSLWVGTSVKREESYALSSATGKLATLIENADTSKNLEKFFALAEAGDQWALLVKGIFDYEVSGYAAEDRARRCNALQTFHRATQAKSSEYEYLAFYLLGKYLASDEHLSDCNPGRNVFDWKEIRRECFEPAIVPLKRATQLNPKFSPAFSQLASAYLGTEQYPEALVAGEFLVALVPNCWEAYLTRGKAFAHLQRVKAAEEDFATAAKLRPGWFDLYNEVFSTFSTLDAPRAFEAAKTALGLPLPADKEDLERRQAHRMLLWHNMGITYRRLGDHDNAARAFEEYLRMGQMTNPQFGPTEIVDWLARYRAARP